MKAFIFVLLIFIPQQSNQYKIFKRCWNDKCEKFDAVVTITTHEVLFYSKKKPNATLRIVQSFELKGKQYHLLQYDTVINDSVIIFYRGVAIVEPFQNTIHIELRTPKTYHFVNYLYK